MFKKVLKWSLGIAVLAVVGILLFWAPGYAMNSKQASESLEKFDAVALFDLAENGAGVFNDNGCAACHVPAAAADGVQIKILQGLGSRYDIAELTALLAAPHGPMPAFELGVVDSEALSVYLLRTFGEK